MLLIIPEQRPGGLTFDQFRVVLGNPDQLECLFDGGVVGQYIQNIALFNRLTHGVHMERCLDGFTFRGYSHHGTKRFQSLPLGGGGKGKERLIVMSALADDCIDVLVGQIHFFLIDSRFFGILFDSNANINQAAAQGLCTFTILSLVCLINDDGELASTELLHILLGKEELLNGTNDNTLFIIDGFRKAAGVLFVINGFHQPNLMFKAVDGVL